MLMILIFAEGCMFSEKGQPESMLKNISSH